MTKRPFRHSASKPPFFFLPDSVSILMSNSLFFLGCYFLEFVVLSMSVGGYSDSVTICGLEEMTLLRDIYPDNIVPIFSLTSFEASVCYFFLILDESLFTWELCYD